MDIKITPSALKGSVSVPPSKSAGHRMLICACLAKETSRITPFCTSQDLRATADCLKALGMKVQEDKEGYTVGYGEPKDNCILDFAESGSTARFFLPIAAALGVKARMIGSGRLPERPMDVLTNLLRDHGVTVSADKLPIEISGKLTGGRFTLPGNISSQFITGLMLAAPLTGEEVEISLTTPLESAGYVDMTVSAMERFGIKVESTPDGWRIPAGQEYKACDTAIEGDWSQAAFFMSAAAIGGDIRIKGLDFGSAQGDMAALDVFAAFGADITLLDDILHIKKGALHGITVNASDIPDMVPAIAATAAFAEGETVIHSAERLRIKESDRIKTTLAALRALNVDCEETEDGMIIRGGRVKGGRVEGANDHRIVMAFSAAAAYAEGESEMLGAEAINKSYPEFFSDFNNLGGKADEINDRR